MTNAETQVIEGDGVIEAEILLNLLQDVAAEKLQLEQTQRAILNILEDFDQERIRVEKANASLQAVNIAMQDFIGIASHDLRSPLAAILGYATTLSDNWDAFSEEGRRDTMATIVRQSQKLSRLIDDLFTLSSIESGGLNAQPEMVLLGEAIDQCLDAGDWDVSEVSVSCPPDLAVLVDPHHLERILGNYVQNAFKYGEPPVRIEATRVGDVAQIRVLDHGPGVPPEFIPKLFSKFARAKTSSTKVNKGAGLGLSIVRGLAEVNGGQTSYESNSPGGGCFVVDLPIFDSLNQ